MFDITFIGHYTRDTIVYPHARRIVNGGAYYFGAYVAARMGLRVAVVTRLARKDWNAVEDLERLGVTVLARETPVSSQLCLTYPTSNLDKRTIELLASAGPITPDQIEGIEPRAYIVAASTVNGEVAPEIVEMLASRGALIALDVQGFMRVIENGKLTLGTWPEKERVLPHVNVLKTDAVEAERLTGEGDPRAAARKLAEYGAREILLTRSAGVMVYHDGVFDQAPFVPKELKGRSGRGDTCTGAYVSRRLTAPPAEAVTWAAAVTSLKLEAEGPFRRDLAEAEELYRQLWQARDRGV